MTMSASSTSLRTIACPAAFFRSTVIDFLLRLCAYHQYDVPSWSFRQVRSGSPVTGLSTLITSAPNCASRLDA